MVEPNSYWFESILIYFNLLEVYLIVNYKICKLNFTIKKYDVKSNILQLFKILRIFNLLIQVNNKINQNIKETLEDDGASKLIVKIRGGNSY